MITKDFIDRARKVHKDTGFGFKYANRKGKEYVTISYNPWRKGTPKYRNPIGSTHPVVHRHIAALFGNKAYVTSGGYSGSDFNVTVRINP